MVLGSRARLALAQNSGFEVVFQDSHGTLRCERGGGATLPEDLFLRCALDILPISLGTKEFMSKYQPLGEANRRLKEDKNDEEAQKMYEVHMPLYKNYALWQRGI